MAARAAVRTQSPTSAPVGMVIPDDESDGATFNAAVGEADDTLDEVAVSNSAKLGPSVKGKPIGMPKLVKIMLEEGAENEIPPTGQTVSLNGKAYIIRPGEEVMVPPGVVEILENAVMSTPIKDPQTMKVIGYRKRLRFPFRKLS